MSFVHKCFTHLFTNQFYTEISNKHDEVIYEKIIKAIVESSKNYVPQNLWDTMFYTLCNDFF